MSNLLTTRVGSSVKVEIQDDSNPNGTLPNYGNVTPAADGGFYWHIASGQSGHAATESLAVRAAARAIRKAAS